MLGYYFWGIPISSDIGTAGLMFPLYALVAIADYKIFQKAGKMGWTVFVPFLSVYQKYDFVWGNGFLFVVEMIPLIGAAFYIRTYMQMAKLFGKDGRFGLGLALLPFIFMPALAFGNAKYTGVQETEIHIELFEQIMADLTK